MKNVDVIRTFINGGRNAKTENLRIIANVLENYSTVLAEFTEYGLIVNSTKYSVSTSKIQSALRFELSNAGISYIELKGLRYGVRDLATHYELQTPKTA